MKLTVFRSAQGDCLLATDDRRNHILVDGGMAESYTDHVAPYLRYLQRRRERIGLVCITHIDQDHITGVLQLLDDLVEWRVWDFQNGRNPRARKPKVVRPPEIDGIWHNAFHELLGANAGPIESMLAAMATGLRADGSSSALATADRYDGLAASERQAILVSRRIGERQLNIPLNPEFDGRLVFVSDPATTTAVGEMRLTVIGPFAEDLEALRDRWNQWLEGAATTIANIRRGAERDEERIGSSDVDLLIGPLLAAARLLGRRSLVTPPNLASIMFLLESGGKSVLLTGDGHWQDVLHGLENAGRLDAEGRLHVDALKVPHHGSEHNTHPDFARAITAKRYVFCGNGSHENPDLDVISTYANSRFGSAAQRSTNREVGHRFEMIFNTSAALETGSRRQHMARVEKHVRELAADSGGQMKFRFLTASRYRFTV